MRKTRTDSLTINKLFPPPIFVFNRIYSDTLRQKHEKSLTELFQRDKNRPSVIMWSVANEPRTHVPISDIYFK